MMQIGFLIAICAFAGVFEHSQWTSGWRSDAQALAALPQSFAGVDCNLPAQISSLCMGGTARIIQQGKPPVILPCCEAKNIVPRASVEDQ